MAELTEETVSNLNKALEATNALLLTTSKQTSQIKDDIEDTTYDVDKSTKKSVKMFDGLYNTLDKMCEKAENIVSIVTGGAFIASIATITKNSWTLDRNMTSLAVQMGLGKAHAKDLREHVSGMMKSFGTNYEQAERLITTLAQAKYSDNLRDAAAGADLFSRATGVAAESVAQLTIQLNRQGDLSAKASNSILAGMTKVQQKVGISRAGMEALTQSISDMAYSMASFGKSSEEISRAAVKTTAFVGAMEKVGVSAQRAVDLISQLTDPDRIEDNILLYSQLGISMEDALSGGAEDALNSDAFKDMANRIMDMGPIAGSQFAKSMGLSYKEVSRMAKMETGSMGELMDEAMTPEEKSLKVLEQLTSEAESFGKKIENWLNKIQGVFLELGPLILTSLTLLAPKILSLFKKVIEKITGREGLQASVETGIKNGIDASQSYIESGLNPFAKITKNAEKFSSSGRENRNDQIRARITNIDSKKASLQNQFEGIQSRGAELRKKQDNGEVLNISEAAELKKIEPAVKRYENELANLAKQATKQYAKLGINKIELQKQEEALASATRAASEQQEKSNAIKKRLDSLNERYAIGTEAERKEVESSLKKVTEEYEKEIQETEKLNLARNEAAQALAKIQKGNQSTPTSVLGKLAQGVSTRASTALGSVKDKITEGGTLSAGGVARKGLDAGMGKLAGAMGGLMKSIGPMAIVIAVIGKVLDKIKEPFMNLIDNLVNQLQPLFENLMPIVCDVLNVLAKALMPPILKVMAGLLKVLNVILKPVEMILKGLSKIPGLGFMKDIADSLDKITGPEVTGALTKAADNIANSNEDLTKATSENTEAAKEEGPAVITATGGKAVLTSGSVTTAANSSVGSTVQTTQQKTSDEERNKEVRRDAESKENNKEIAAQTVTLGDLRAQMTKISNYLSQIVGYMGKPTVAGTNVVLGAEGSSN